MTYREREEDLDEKYDRTIAVVQQLIITLQKHYQLKLVSWIKKLDMPINNDGWKENRNLYVEVMMKMLENNSIISPFDKNPPQGALPRFNVYDLPYPLRIQISTKSKSKSIQKTSIQKSLFKQSNLRSNLKSFNETQQTKKPSPTPIQSQSHQNSTCKFSLSLQLQSGRNSIIKRTITQRKLNYQKCQQIGQQLQQNKLFHILKRTLKFLKKNQQLLIDQQQYSSLMSDIVLVGDQNNHNLRNIDTDFSPNHLKQLFKKTNHRIINQIVNTNQQNECFINYEQHKQF